MLIANFVTRREILDLDEIHKKATSRPTYSK